MYPHWFDSHISQGWAQAYSSTTRTSLDIKHTQQLGKSRLHKHMDMDMGMSKAGRYQLSATGPSQRINSTHTVVSSALAAQGKKQSTTLGISLFLLSYPPRPITSLRDSFLFLVYADYSPPLPLSRSFALQWATPSSIVQSR